MFVCGVPKGIDEFAFAFSEAEGQFGKLSLSLEAAKEIFAIRPDIFLAITAPDGTVAAFSSAYPLKSEWAQSMIAGDTVEPDLAPDKLLATSAQHDRGYVYVGTVMVSSIYDPFTKSILLASLLSWRARQLNDLAVNRMTAIMTPVTKEGKRLVQYIGAKRLGGKTDVNNHEIYGREISPDLIYRMTSSMERLLNKSLVSMNYERDAPRLVPALHGAHQTACSSLEPA